ncbi:MAG: SsrA-binding protein, partial [Acutalibacteraceae bacterium]|nr:SsrA-binding protein [Acutalibacteraceae bacterium]
MSDDNRTISRNKKAFHDYFVVESFEAGIELYGTEIKSIRGGNVNLKDYWCSIDDGELFANGIHISPYEQGNIFNRDPYRKRKLLMHKREIMRLFG